MGLNSLSPQIARCPRRRSAFKQDDQEGAYFEFWEVLGKILFLGESEKKEGEEEGTEKRCRCWGGECGRSSREDVQVRQASLMELVTYARYGRDLASLS